MPIIDNKILTPITYVQDLSRQPTPSEVMTFEQLQAKFDQGAEDLRVKHNSLIDDVISINTAKDISIATANTNASNAVNTASSASSVATNANTNATNAVSTANNANTNANNAVSTANSADTKATDAKAKAIAVETDYNLVKPQLLQAVADVALKVDKDYVDQVALNFQNGVTLDNSITNVKMANEMKKGIAGGVASYDEVAASLADYAVHKAEVTTYTTRATRAVGTTGTQKITCGFRPKAININAIVEGTKTASWGVVDSSGNSYCNKQRGDTSIINTIITGVSLQIDGTNSFSASIASIDNDGFTLNWTAVGSPTGTVYLNIQAFTH